MLLATLALSGALAASAQAATTVGTWADLVTAVAAGGTVQLTANITAPANANLVVGATAVTLDLNGQQLIITAPAAKDAAIEVPSGDSLTIEDSAGGGTLTATGGEYAAGIGGNELGSLAGETAGSITIDSGTVDATAGSTPAKSAGGAAAIGGGGGASFSVNGGNGGQITINGGNVTATGGVEGAGLGGGSGNSGGAGGEIMITGGTVSATGGFGAPGIGAGAGFGLAAGAMGGSGGTITISGGAVTAIGGPDAPGVGGGASNYAGGAGGTVALTGGSLNATGTPAVGGGLGTGQPGGNGAALSISSGAALTATSASGSVIGGGAGAPAGGFGSLTNAGTLTVPVGSELDVPSGDSAANQSTGRLEIDGTLGGDGTVDNTGAIIASGTVSGHGDGNGTTGLLIEPNNYSLSFDLNGGSGATPATEYVYAGSAQAGGVTLPSAATLPAGATAFAGWYTASSGGSQVLGTSGLTVPFGNGPLAVTLHAQYTGPISITTQPTNQFTTAGGSVSFTAAASAYQAPSIQWQYSSDGGKTWANVAGASSDTLTLSDLTVGQSGTEYRAVFTELTITATSNAAALSVSPLAGTGPGTGTSNPPVTVPINPTLTDIINPTLIAKISGGGPKSKYGWYRHPVTVSFTCSVQGTTLTTACPGPVTLAGNRRGQSVSRTIRTADGGVATAGVRHINIDTRAPRVSIALGRRSSVANGSLPLGRCAAHDALSGIASCSLTRHVSRRGSETIVRITAVAIDRAGNRSVATRTFRIRVAG